MTAQSWQSSLQFLPGILCAKELFPGLAYQTRDNVLHEQ